MKYGPYLQKEILYIAKQSLIRERNMFWGNIQT